jgi:hypothetical protein
MHRELAAYQRLLITSYRRYLEAEHALSSGLSDMRALFPPDCTPYRGTIGAPGSRVRRLYEYRDRALLRLHTAREEFKAARARSDQRHVRPPKALFLTVRVEGSATS